MELSEWLKAQRRSQKWLADELKVTPARVCQVAHRGTNSLRLAIEIGRVTEGAVTPVDMLGKWEG